MNPVLKTAIEIIVNNLKSIFTFIAILVTQQKSALISLILLILIATSLGIWYYFLNSQYQTILLNTLKLESEPTPQNYKGVESFILSYIDKPVVDSLRNSSISKAFSNEFKNMEKTIKSYTFIDRTKKNGKRNPLLPIIHPAHASKDGKTLTDNSPVGFLFFPIYILGKTFDSNIENSLRDKTDSLKVSRVLNNALDEDIYLINDIVFTKSLSKHLQKFTTINITNRVTSLINIKPFQVYIISKNGINRIFNQKHQNDADIFYGSQFPPNAFFPSRPYFWQAFSDKGTYYHSTLNTVLSPESGDKISKKFYVSHPYMDLAGNGFVITVSRGIEIDGKIKAVVCFDFSLKNENLEVDPKVKEENFPSIANTLLSLISKISDWGNNRESAKSKQANLSINELLRSIESDNYFTKYHQASCTINEDDFQVKSTNSNDDDDPIYNEFSTFINEISDNKLDKSEAIGKIQVFKKDNSSIKLSIPVGDVKFNENGQTLEVILFSINLNSFQNTITNIGLFSLVIFGLIISLLFYLYGVTIKRTKEYEIAFQQVDLVMYKSPIPYVRLDENDRIKDTNAAFRENFGYETTKNNSMNEITFRSLCANEGDFEEYDKAQTNRKKHEPVKPYLLNMRTKENHIKRYYVISSEVPSTSPGSFPETFGILLDPEDTIHMKYLKLPIDFS